ncbi:AraC family transcriptional regulator [Spongiimicrobium sp. 3-5]|uniref:AraC family transcriptional regulator n=1 Tax=Spongiimicrobium sp. 3-5 TaxID=3332596 RepID=UPI00397F7B58
MKSIPILNIEQFEQEESLADFYSNNLAPHLAKNKEIVHKPHRHNFFLCVLFTKGSGLHEIDFSAYPVTPGSVFFLKPGQTHSWNFNSTPEGYIFFHTQNFYELYFSNKKLVQFPFFYSYKNPPNLLLGPDNLRAVASRFKEINTEYNESLVYKKQKLASLVNLAYIELTRFYAGFEPQKKMLSSTYLNTLDALENKIERYYKTEKSAKFYAESLNVTSKHLNRIVRTTLNKTTTELINERILLEAKRLIVHSENSLASISEILGYEDYAYFSRVFKLKTNSTPLEFKKSYHS